VQFQKRRRILINRSLQYAAVAYALAVVVLVLGFHSWVTYERVSAEIAADPTAKAHVLLQDVFISLVIMAAGIAYIGIAASHKVAGPVFRCEKTLKLLQEGDLTDVVRLRRGDFLVSFSEELNHALANLREFAAEDRAHVQEAARLISLARGAVAPEVQASLDRAVQALGRVGSRLKIETDAARARTAAALAEAGSMAPALGGSPAYFGSAGANKTMSIAPPVVRRDGDATVALPRAAVTPPPGSMPVPAAVRAGPPAGAPENDRTVAMVRPDLTPPPGQMAVPAAIAAVRAQILAQAPAPAAPAAASPDNERTLAMARPDLTPPPGNLARTVAHRPAFLEDTKPAAPPSA
jgi:hypothetical protein